MHQVGKIGVACLTVLTCCSAPSIAGADPVVLFTDPAAFRSAATNLQVIDFEGLAPNMGCALTLSGVQFSGGNCLLPVTPATASVFGYTGPGTVLMNLGVIEASSMDARLPGGVTAVGMDLLSLPFVSGFPRAPITITLSTGEAFTIAGDPMPERQFVGFTSVNPILSIRYFSSGRGSAVTSRIGLDDFQFGQAQPEPIPEPSTVLLLGSGLAWIGAAVRKRRKAH